MPYRKRDVVNYEWCPICRKYKHPNDFNRDRIFCKECDIKVSITNNKWWEKENEIIGRIKKIAESMINHSKILADKNVSSIDRNQNIALLGHTLNGLLNLLECVKENKKIDKELLEITIANYYNSTLIFRHTKDGYVSLSERRAIKDFELY